MLHPAIRRVTNFNFSHLITHFHVIYRDKIKSGTLLLPLKKWNFKERDICAHFILYIFLVQVYPVFKDRLFEYFFFD